MTLADAIRALARDARPLDWDAWFPLAQAAAHDPHTLVEAVGGLNDEDQYALLDHLKADPGPLSDYLLATLAAHPSVFSDEQVSAYALRESDAPLARHAAALTALAEALRATVGRLERQAAPDFDTATEVVELETRRNVLRAEQIEAGYGEMAEVEWEIDRLEMLRSRLVGYDPAERRARRDALTVETERLGAERKEVEAEVARAIRNLDETQAAVDAARAQHEAAVAELASAEARRAELSAQVEEATTSIATLTAATAAARAESAGLLDESERVKAALLAEQARLDELRASPLGEAAQRLRSEIRALYGELPDDEADPMFGTRGRRT